MQQQPQPHAPRAAKSSKTAANKSATHTAAPPQIYMLIEDIQRALDASLLTRLSPDAVSLLGFSGGGGLSGDSWGRLLSLCAEGLEKTSGARLVEYVDHLVRAGVFGEIGEVSELGDRRRA